MEDNKTPDIPLPCTNGCGFYGNPIFQNMCSKCFSEKQKSKENLQAAAAAVATSTTTSLSSPAPSIPSETTTQPTTPSTTESNTNNNKEEDQVNTVKSVSVTESTTLVVEEEESKDEKPVQKNKGRCFVCRTKIPLTKQLTNKCRCDYVFCDSHRYPDKHECQFDHASMDKDILAKNNPKLNDRPRGGRSFQRLDSV